MANRYYSTINGKLSAPQPPAQQKGVGPVQPRKESTANWPGIPGPVGPKRNTVNFPEVKGSAKQVMPDDHGPKKPVSQSKAKKILRDGEIRGKPLTDPQEGLFGLIAGGGTPRG